MDIQIRLYRKGGMYTTPTVDVDMIKDASMLIVDGVYYYYHRTDTTNNRILGEPIFKEGSPPVDITHFIKGK